MPKTVIQKKAMLLALEKNMGIVSKSTKQAGISRCTHYRWLLDDREYKMKVLEIDNVALDFAESKLHTLIRKGDTAATIFFLKTKGKGRGYVERSEFNINNLKLGVDLAEEEQYV